MITYINPDAIEDQSIDWSKLKPANVTYEELVALRNNSQLNPGQQYRITDYVTTTTQSDTQSAGHQFDIIVVADDVNALNENARAIQHDGDTYFADSDINAWQLWYCLDNDTSRFAWADATNGKGVIYYMKDEFNNECPYDFKNIKFAHPNDTITYPDYYYTFSTVINGSVTDHSMLNGYCFNNIIKEYIETIQLLNPNVFINTDKTSYCYSNKFGNYCYANSFGNNCHSNSFGNYCLVNSFGSQCYSNSFGNYCSNNSFGHNCYNNSFGHNCYNNSFGNNCSYNSFGNNCHSNSFGSQCYSNSFGNYCYNNSFGNNCSYNSFGNYCYFNSFGNKCSYNSFGNYCYFNSFGNSCHSNSFGNSCSYNSFGQSSSNLKPYYRYIIFDNGNSYINLNCTSTTSSSKYFQNVRIGLGVNNATAYKTISDSNVGQTYETLYKPANSQTITI